MDQPPIYCKVADRDNQQCASVSRNVVCRSPNVDLEQLSVSTNVGQKPLLIVRLAKHHCASLQLPRVSHCFWMWKTSPCNGVSGNAAF